MIDVSLESFEKEVVLASQTSPILIDFWAPWCAPCQVIGPILETLEAEYGGRFVLAKINTEQEQQLAAMFGIRSIPTVILMSQGQAVDGFQGALGKRDIEAFLDKHLPAATDPLSNGEISTHEQIQMALERSDHTAAQQLLEQALSQNPEDEALQFNYIKVLLLSGQQEAASAALAPLLAQNKRYAKWSSLQIWLDTLASTRGQEDSGPNDRLAELDARIAQNPRDLASRFMRAQTLMIQQKWYPAMDELLEILMRQKEWENGKARLLYIALLEIAAPFPAKVELGQIPPEYATLATYRRRLSSIVLS